MPNGTLMLMLLILALVSQLLSSPAEAKDIQGRLGVGYNAQFANVTAQNGTPGVSLKYGFSREVSTELVVGLATGDPANSVIAAKFMKNVFFETNLNFYFLVGGGLLNGNGTTGAEFLGGMGCEFFIPGIESLGLSMEMGASLNNLSGSFIVRTMGVSFLNAGMHFYF